MQGRSLIAAALRAILEIMRTLFALLVLGGCATTGVELVPQADWSRVPVAERGRIDQDSAAQLQAAQGELESARTAYARASLTAPAARTAMPATTAEPDPLLRDYAASRHDARARVDVAQHDWQQVNVRWLEQRVTSAAAHIEVVRCDREATRAQSVDRHMLGDDRYDIAPYRGQLAAAQEAWYRASRRAAETRGALIRAGAELASKKEAYAQVMRTGPAALPDRDPTASMRLSSGLGARAHRRGLHVATHDTPYLRTPTQQ